jgi:hypothetical protein
LGLWGKGVFGGEFSFKKTIKKKKKKKKKKERDEEEEK